MFSVLIAELALGDLADHLTFPFRALCNTLPFVCALISSNVAPRLAKSILVQLAGGLDHIHSLGIVHRDIRPAVSRKTCLLTLEVLSMIRIFSSYRSILLLPKSVILGVPPRLLPQYVSMFASTCSS